ncbi:retron St85 family RNA-directed DNA polymerase [Vogesella alkaliphila]|uniref:RNA-directed DNA polymerase n=1 Tax=Vogesella alkaliphila TaxID=1193621 RepID=A0ABQ2Z0N9_9NEIS|nr:retron St85 family RNA-directed DNA polymerase [Vogesella alkaliphila]GGX99978.1 RNA-directed DNA polymerase [Vogesella alkaliphila]
MRISKKLADELLLDEAELRKFCATAPYRYKKYEIPKRNSDKTRLIAQPSKEVKFMQRLVVKYLRDILPVSRHAMAYESGTSIVKNASIHKNNPYLLKMDFKNFFLSITPSLFFGLMSDGGVEFSDDDKILLSNLLFWKLRRNSPLRLSVGAPSSPFISNVVMYHFDCLMESQCAAMRIRYSRYADDMTFSTRERDALSEMPGFVRSVLKRDYDGKIKVNSEKTIFLSKAKRRTVTGITITNDDTLSVGRDRKRNISAMVHHFSLGKLSAEEVQKLKGYLSFVAAVEPNFIYRMMSKYGNKVIEALFI